MPQMTLEHYIKALGMTEGAFFFKLGMPLGLLKTLTHDELPICKAYAEKICVFLSQEFQRPITITDIKDLKVC